MTSGGGIDLQLHMVQRINGSWLVFNTKQDFDTISSKAQGTLQKRVCKGTSMSQNIEKRAAKEHLLRNTESLQTQTQQPQLTH